MEMTADSPASAEPAPRAGRWLLGALVLLLWGILCRQLSVEWTVNEQYQYGWFVPLFSIYLGWLRWTDRPPIANLPPAKMGRSLMLFAATALILLLPLRLFEVANPEWRPLSWLHALIAVSLTLLAIFWVGGRSWLRHFAFPVCFFLVAVPWVTPIEVPIVQGLQHIVAGVVTEMMGWLGIPAQLEGSVIRLRTGVVGVNEACSGVRSLQTSIMAGLLFGELNRLNWQRRIALVLMVVSVALCANVFRGAFLVWTAAQRGVEAVAGVHDLAGNIVLGLVVVGSYAIATLVTPRKRRASSHGPAQGEATSAVSQSLHRLPWVLPILCWLLAIEVGVEAWYRSHETGLTTQPRWTVRWPRNEAGYHPVKIDEQTRLTLRFDEGGAGSWNESVAAAGGNDPAPAGSSEVGWLLYFFRWEPGRSSTLRAKAHRPDVCFPNTGWKQTADRGVTFFEAAPGLSLPFRHFEFMHPGLENGREIYAHAFFCLQEDKVATSRIIPGQANKEVTGKVGGWEWPDRVRVVKEGRRDMGQQVMEVVVTSHRELSGDAADRLFANQLATLVSEQRGGRERPVVKAP